VRVTAAMRTGLREQLHHPGSFVNLARTLVVKTKSAVVAWAVAWLCAAGWPCAAGAVAPPNIVFILADDLGYGDLGVTGQNARAAAGLPSFATPNIDSIAQGGMRFTQMYAGAPTCSPSRNSLLTGFHEGHTVFDRANIEQDIRGGVQDRTWGQMLQDAGYETGMYGKWHLGGFLNTVRAPHALPTQKGFEDVLTGGQRQLVYWEDNGAGSIVSKSTPHDPTYTGPGAPYAYGDDLATDRAVQFIREKTAAAQPFAAYLPLIAPHTPLNYVPPDHPYADKPWSQAHRNYAGMIHRLDQHVGQVLATLDDPNNDGDTSDSVADDTLVIFASDNGPMINDFASGYQTEFFDSNGSFSGAKFLIYEGAVRTPFMARWTGTIAAGTVNDSHVGSFADVFPTFADLVGQDAPLGIDGQSMLGVLVGGPAGERAAVQGWLQERELGPANPAGYAIRVGDWKLIQRLPTSTFPTPSFRLFNVASDPRELTNLAGSRPDLVDALKVIAEAEGFGREPFAPHPSDPVQEVKNTYFTQYKSWSPQEGSSDFFSADNWSGGTQTSGRNGDPEAQNWNTGPADNWLATLVNQSASPSQTQIEADATVLALGVAGPAAEMRVVVPAGRVLSARNGIRIEVGGVLELNGGELNTVRDVDVRAGGELQAFGTINGQQQSVAGIAEFAGLRLFEPRLTSAGAIEIGAAAPAVLDVLGEFQQDATGTIRFDLFASSGGAGVAFDQLAVQRTARLGGALEVAVAPGSWTPQLGDSFTLLSAAGGVTGIFSTSLLPSLQPGNAWSINYTANAVALQVISATVSGSADFDNSGVVDGLDFLIWQRNAGRTGATLQDGDANLDTFVDAADLLIWRNAMQGNGLPVSAPVPEPAAWSMAALAAAGLASRTRRVRDAQRVRR
jgi:arylsulfatase A-like enzyme